MKTTESYLTEVVKGILEGMNSRVQTLVEAFPVAPGEQVIRTKEDARRAWAGMSAEQRMGAIRQQGLEGLMRMLGKEQPL